MGELPKYFKDEDVHLLDGYRHISEKHILMALKVRLEYGIAYPKSENPSIERDLCLKLKEQLSPEELLALPHLLAGTVGLKSTWYHAASNVFFSKFDTTSRFVGALKGLLIVASNYFRQPGAFRNRVLNITIFGRNKNTDSVTAGMLCKHYLKTHKQHNAFPEVDYELFRRKLNEARVEGGNIIKILTALSTDSYELSKMNNPTQNYCGLLIATLERDVKDVNLILQTQVATKNWVGSHPFGRASNRSLIERNLPHDEYDMRLLTNLSKIFEIDPVKLGKFIADDYHASLQKEMKAER